MKKDHKHYQVWREWLQAQLDGRDFEVRFCYAGETPRYVIEEPTWHYKNDYKVVYKDKYTFGDDLSVILAIESKFPLFNTKEEAIDYRESQLKELGHPHPDSKHMPVWQEAAKRRLLGQKVTIEYCNCNSSFRPCSGIPMWLAQVDYRIAEERYSVVGGRMVPDPNGTNKESLARRLMEASTLYQLLPEPYASKAIDLYCSGTAHRVYTRLNKGFRWELYSNYHNNTATREFIVVPNPGPVRREDMKKDTCYWVVKPGQGIYNLIASSFMANQCSLGLVFDNRDAASVKEDNINLFLKDDV